MTAKNGSKILIGLTQILDYTQISKPLFYQFVQKGLPAVVINNRWYAHTDNIDDFFKRVTRVHMNQIPEDAE